MDSVFFLGKVTKGTLVLGNGHHELDVKLGETPTTVYVSLKVPCDDCIPVCGGGENKVAITITKHGFKAIADIETNCALLHWACEF